MALSVPVEPRRGSGFHLEAEALRSGAPPLLDPTGKHLQSVIDIFPGPDTDDQDYEVLTLDQVDDSIIPNSQPEELLGALQLLDDSRSRIVFEAFNLLHDLALSVLGKLSQLLLSSLEELDGVGHARGLQPQPPLDLL